MSGENKRTNKAIVLFTILAILILMFTECNNTYAASKLGLSVSLPDKAKPAIVKCRWKSKLEGIKLYKITARYKDKAVFSKKTKKAKGALTLKKLKKNRRYSVVIEAFDKAGTVKKTKSRYITTGVQIPDMDPEMTVASGESIVVGFLWGTGKAEQYTPDKAYLYRKAGSGKWKLIKSFKAAKKSDITFTDKDVKTGETYKYRARLRDTIKVKGKKKTLYSAYSETIVKTAMNENGHLTCAFADTTPQQKEMPLIDLDVAMDKYNYDAEFDFDKPEAWASKDLAGEESAGAKYDITEYRLNGGDWQEAKGKVTVKAGESIGLRLKLAEGQELLDFTEDRRIAIYNMKYNEKSEFMMSVWPGSGRGSVHPTEWEY